MSGPANVAVRLHGYDGGKKVSGVKRHLLVDTRGPVLVTCVSPAGVGDRDGAVVLKEVPLTGEWLVRPEQRAHPRARVPG